MFEDGIQYQKSLHMLKCQKKFQVQITQKNNCGPALFMSMWKQMLSFFITVHTIHCTTRIPHASIVGLANWVLHPRTNLDTVIPGNQTPGFWCAMTCLND